MAKTYPFFRRILSDRIFDKMLAAPQSNRWRELLVGSIDKTELRTLGGGLCSPLG